MSQYIQKFADGTPNGGVQSVQNNSETQTVQQTKKKQDEPDFKYFEYNGGKYNLQKYISDLEFNFESWLNSKNIKEKDKNKIREAYRNMIEGYADQSITPGLGNVSLDNKGRYPKTKEDEYAYGVAQTYFNTILKYQKAWEAPKKEKINFDLGKTNEFINQDLFGTKSFSGAIRNNFLLQDDDYDVKTGKRGTTERVKALYNAILKHKQNVIDLKVYDDIDDDQRNDYISKLDQALKALQSDWRIDNKEKLALSVLGIDPDDYLFTGEKYSDETTQTTPEAEKTPLQQADDEFRQIQEQQLLDFKQWRNRIFTVPESSLKTSLSNFGTIKSPLLYQNISQNDIKRVKEKLRDCFNRFQKFVRTHNIFKLNPAWLKQKFDVGRILGSDFRNLFDKKSGKYLIDQNWTNAQAINFLLKNWVSLIGQIDQGSVIPNVNGTNEYILSIDDNRGYVTVVNDNGQIYQKRLASLPDNILQNIFIKKYPWLQAEQQVESNKNGGILKQQYGGYFTIKPDSEFVSEYKAEQEKQKQELINASGMTPEQYEAANRNLADGLTGVDKARGAAIAMDLASVLASATGVGSIAGGGLSFGATLTELGVDIADDAVSTGSALSNFALGLGLTALSFIPFVGGAGKAASLTNKAIKWTRNALKLIPTLAAAGVVFNADIQKTLSKVNQFGLSGVSQGKYTNEDLRNIATFIGAITGLTRQGIITGKKAIIKSNADKVTTTGYKVKTNKGELDIDEVTYNKLKEVNKAEDANKILKEYKGTDEYKVIGSGSKWKLGLGEKTNFNSDKQLSSTTTTSQYAVNPNNLTKWGRRIYGNPNNPYSDISLTLGYLNRPSMTFGWGFNNKPQTTTTPYVPLVPNSPLRRPVVTIPEPYTGPAYQIPYRYLPENRPISLPMNWLRSVNSWRYGGNRGNSWGLGDGLNARERALGIEHKEGGKLSKIVKNAQGGQVLKLQKSPNIPNPNEEIQWYDYTQGEDWQNAISYDTRFKHNPNKTIEPRKDIKATNDRIPGDLLYDSEGDATWLESQEYYKAWYNRLINNEGLAKRWADQYLELHKDDKIGKHYRQLWYINGQFNFNNFKQSVEKLSWDKKLGIAHDIIGSVYLDPNTNRVVKTLPIDWSETGEYEFDPNKGVIISKIKQEDNPETTPETSNDPNKKILYYLKTDDSRPDFETDRDKYFELDHDKYNTNNGYEVGEIDDVDDNGNPITVQKENVTYTFRPIIQKPTTNDNSFVSEVSKILGLDVDDNVFKIDPWPYRALKAGVFGIDTLNYLGNRLSQKRSFDILNRGIVNPLYEQKNYFSPVYGRPDALALADTEGANLRNLTRNSHGTDQERNYSYDLASWIKGYMPSKEQALSLDTSKREQTLQQQLANNQRTHESGIDIENQNREIGSKTIRDKSQLAADYEKSKQDTKSAYLGNIGSELANWANTQRKMDENKINIAATLWNTSAQIELQTKWNNLSEEQRKDPINQAAYQNALNQLATNNYNFLLSNQNSLYGTRYGSHITLPWQFGVNNNTIQFT